LIKIAILLSYFYLRMFKRGGALFLLLKGNIAILNRHEGAVQEFGRAGCMIAAVVLFFDENRLIS